MRSVKVHALAFQTALLEAGAPAPTLSYVTNDLAERLEWYDTNWIVSIDFEVDGTVDVVANHIDRPSASVCVTHPSFEDVLADVRAVAGLVRELGL